jgi:hypothetical protein
MKLRSNITLNEDFRSMVSWAFIFMTQWDIVIVSREFYYLFSLFLNTLSCYQNYLCKSTSKSLPNQLGIHLFLAKQENLCSNSLASNLANFNNLANLLPPRVYLRAERERASGFACGALRSLNGALRSLSGALRFLAGLFVRLAGLFLFYQIQMANFWRKSIFSLAIYFSKLPNHDIC